MTNTNELKPCPFCGGQAKPFKENLDERFAYADRVTYRCTGCSVGVSAMGAIPHGGYADNSTVEKRALEAWNRRAALPSDAAQAPVAVIGSGWQLLYASREPLAAIVERHELKIGDKLYAAPVAPAAAAPFQDRVLPWMMECFGAEISADRVERNHRFFEESTELVQSCGMTASEAHQLVDYVFGRPVGEPHQEVGGVMVTLAALCLANDLNMHADGETELARISVPETVAKIRAKQAAKPKHSPLPIATVQPNAEKIADAMLARAREQLATQDDALTERATLAAANWANSNTPVSTALAYRDGYVAGEREFHEAVVRLVNDMIAAWAKRTPYREIPSEMQARISALLTAPVPSDDTAHLLASPANAVRLKRSIDEFNGVQPDESAACSCEICRPLTMADMRMVLCSTCGKKRCPHATDHRNACTDSNEPGQPGSSWENVKGGQAA